MDRISFLKSLSIGSAMMSIDSLRGLESWVSTQSLTEKMPVLFLGHGSPMNAIEDNQFVKGFRDIAKSIPIPKAIICISAHWYTRGTQVMSSAMPKTIHDFGGFPEKLFQVQYPAKGEPDLAKEVADLLIAEKATLSDDWGLDHGAWSVLVHLYPQANIPVIQLSIDYTKDAAYHFNLANQLKSLRNKGVLIVGSGNIVHNLGMIDWENMNKENHGYDWAREVREKTNKAILEGDNDTLIHYQKNGKAFENAIPTPDHYLPLIYSLGLKDKNETVNLFNDKLMAGSLSMTSVKFG
jgi:4,5-DOPA dioxygenase extradiol